MDTSTFSLLCESSQLSFSDEQKESFIQKLNAMTEFASSVKKHNFDFCDEDDSDSESVFLSDLREDTVVNSFSPEKLLANTKPLFDCYVIPKIME
ncbi:MAG: hypothetical protein FWG70_04020 [Oscillospiraceae bacterium]|nr:hypothetical protein [Oscillospiraceae bacterium]